ncbi:MAG: MdtA/MuxA family multidrug efflux RND transporter periplasmic adaptor subunit [Burkholderiaceae bacterium]|nr:MdtA/MuxA family multidrug efflux RND transporter periplasmic adaptor subunit [Burkholderiaceae bacterium]
MSDTPSASYRQRFRWLWILIVVLALVGGYWFFSGKSQTGQSGPQTRSAGRGAGMMGMATPVRIATAEAGPVNHMIKAIGTVTAFNTVIVRSRVDGELQKIVFEDGQKVAQGDLLAEIDPRSFQVQLDQAVGQQQQNAAQLQNAQRDLQRYQQLYKQNSIAKQQLDAQAALVQQYQGSSKSDQAAVDSAKLQLSFTKITAPISGRLGLGRLDQGNMINASNADGLVTITQVQPISVVFTLPQAELPDVLRAMRAGKTLVTELYDSSDASKIASGELVSVDNQIDVATGTVKLKAQFANDDEALFPNQFASVRLQVGATDSLFVPTIAIQQGSAGAFVYRVDQDNTVHIQRVITGRTDDGKVAIVSGLELGQRVVIEGTDRLREGAAVQIIDAATATDVSPPAATPGPSQAGGQRAH